MVSEGANVLVEDGRIKLDATDEIIASSLVTRDGRVVHQGALEAKMCIRDRSYLVLPVRPGEPRED